MTPFNQRTIPYGQRDKQKTRASTLRSAKRGGCIEITGQGGSPVYAHGLLHTAEEGDSMEEGVRENTMSI